MSIFFFPPQGRSSQHASVDPVADKGLECGWRRPLWIEGYDGHDVGQSQRSKVAGREARVHILRCSLRQAMTRVDETFSGASNGKGNGHGHGNSAVFPCCTNMLAAPESTNSLVFIHHLEKSRHISLSESFNKAQQTAFCRLAWQATSTHPTHVRAKDLSHNTGARLLPIRDNVRNPTHTLSNTSGNLLPLLHHR